MKTQWQMVYNGGIGDLFTFESHLSGEKKDSLEAIYWRHENREIIEPLMALNPKLKHVKHYDGWKVQPPDDAYVWRLFECFANDCKHYYGSSFLKLPNIDISEFNLPEDFFVILPSTPANCPSFRQLRDLSTEEWALILDELEVQRIPAVVVNGPGGDPAPEHELIIDIQGQTTYAQSIEILKHGVGFMGIASSLTVLASQLFKPTAMLVKGPEDNLHMHKNLYFAPHKHFRFLRKHLVNDPYIYPEESIGKVLVEVLKLGLYQGKWISPGEQIWVEREVAFRWDNRDFARIIDDPNE